MGTERAVEPASPHPTARYWQAERVACDGNQVDPQNLPSGAEMTWAELVTDPVLAGVERPVGGGAVEDAIEDYGVFKKGQQRLPHDALRSGYSDRCCLRCHPGRARPPRALAPFQILDKWNGPPGTMRQRRNRPPCRSETRSTNLVPEHPYGDEFQYEMS